MDLDGLIKEIRTITDWFVENKISEVQDGDYISNLIVKLASYNASLGQYVADLDRDADLAKARFEMKREGIYKEARDGEKDEDGKLRRATIADADNLKRLEASTEEQEAIEAKHRFKVALILRQDVANLIDALRSKLSYMKQERENTK